MYTAIHSLIRLIKNGLECKQRVDDVIDSCANYVNLRDNIENWRVQAEQEADEINRKRAIKRGLLALKRYFILIVFASYLDTHDPGLAEDLESFKFWMNRHQEFVTIMREEIDDADLEGLVPVEKLNPGQ